MSLHLLDSRDIFIRAVILAFAIEMNFRVFGKISAWQYIDLWEHIRARLDKTEKNKKKSSGSPTP